MTPTLFGPTELQALVAGALEQIPAGKTNAIIGTVDQTGVQMLVTCKLGDEDRWSVTGAARHNWSGDTQASATVVYTW